MSEIVYKDINTDQKLTQNQTWLTQDPTRPEQNQTSKTQPSPVLYAKNQDAVRCFGNQPKSCVDEENFFSTD